MVMRKIRREDDQVQSPFLQKKTISSTTTFRHEAVKEKHLGSDHMRAPGSDEEMRKVYLLPSPTSINTTNHQPQQSAKQRLENTRNVHPTFPPDPALRHYHGSEEESKDNCRSTNAPFQDHRLFIIRGLGQMLNICDAGSSLILPVETSKRDFERWKERRKMN
jgi:hypothetical protein